MQIASEIDGDRTTTKYDPFGRRIQKSGPNGTANYLYDGARLMEEVDSSGNVLARYTHSPEVDEPLSMLRGTATSYYQNDGIGSITSLSNQAVALASTYTFDSFSQLTASTGTITNPFRYTGREFDTETGIYYYRARYFDPGSGRFISEDPIRFGGDGGPNFYAYVNNDPTDFVDPLGLKCCDVPTHPPGVSIEANSAQAQANGYRWWVNTVGQWGGPWDYKNWNNEHHPEYEDFGNFNAGATACALHIPLWITLRGAEWAKERRLTNDPDGYWWWKWPYGNADEKQRQVMAGWGWCHDGCAQPNPQVGAAPTPRTIILAASRRWRVYSHRVVTEAGCNGEEFISCTVLAMGSSARVVVHAGRIYRRSITSLLARTSTTDARRVLDCRCFYRGDRGDSFRPIAC